MEKESIVKKIVLLVMFFGLVCFTAESALPKFNNSASKATVNVPNGVDTTGSIGDSIDTQNSSEISDSSASKSETDSQTTETSLATLPIHQFIFRFATNIFNV